MLTIVVIEQDMAMRTLFSEWLQAEGYRVRSCGDRPATVEQDVDLVIVDLVNLPSQGAEAVRQVRSVFPGAALIGISTQLSRPLAADAPQALALGLGGLVPKPCTRRELVSAVVETIGAAR